MRLVDADTIPYCSYLGDDEPRVYKSEIDAMPAIDPVKHGKWIDEDTAHNAICSYCGKINKVSKHCPNCGAKMDGEV